MHNDAFFQNFYGLAWIGKRSPFFYHFCSAYSPLWRIFAVIKVIKGFIQSKSRIYQKRIFLPRFFFSHGIKILEFLCRYTCIFRTISEKFNCRTIRINWEIEKKLKNVDFFTCYFLFLKLKPSIFAFAKKPTFAVQVLGE